MKTGLLKCAEYGENSPVNNVEITQKARKLQEFLVWITMWKVWITGVRI